MNLQTTVFSIAAILCGCLLAFTFTPPVRILAYRIGAVDVPTDGRRMHKKPVPRIGGLAIYLAFVLATALFGEYSPALGAIWVVGEEGTSLEDYVVYLKAEMLDSVYLQQNSFDLTDANCSTARQRYVTDKLICVLGSEYALDSKDGARSFFNRMRQKFIDWNYTEFESAEFKAAEQEIDALYEEGKGVISREAELLLKGGA